MDIYSESSSESLSFMESLSSESLSSMESLSSDSLSTESLSTDGVTTEHVHHPAFFQLYLSEHNSTKLRIPPPFIKNFGGNIPEKISLKNSSGRVWPAKLTFLDKKLHITYGWNRYVKDHKLQSGEFVIFRYQHDSTFLVMVYGPDNLLKKEPKEKKVPTKSRGDDRRCTDVHVTEVGSLMFYKNFKNKFKNSVGVPKHILEACKISLPQRVKLINENGIGVKTHLRQTADRVILGYDGLPKFWRKNGVEEGDKLEFEVICKPGNKIKQIIMRNKTQSNVFGRGY